MTTRGYISRLIALILILAALYAALITYQVKIVPPSSSRRAPIMETYEDDSILLFQMIAACPPEGLCQD